jgi:hypothetical protein
MLLALAVCLSQHAFGVETKGDGITAVRVIHVKTSEEKRFSSSLFADCTGHATIGAGGVPDSAPQDDSE